MMVMEWPDWALGHIVPFKIKCEPEPVGMTVDAVTCSPEEDLFTSVVEAVNSPSLHVEDLPLKLFQGCFDRSFSVCRQ